MSSWTDVNLGRLSREEAVNIAREVRKLWMYAGDICPGGVVSAKATLKVTLDKSGQYHFWLNSQALVSILMFAKNMPAAPVKQATECPPEVPDFLRWDTPSDLKPE